MLKANHSVQGEHVWLCKRSEQADNKDEIIVQHALDGSIVTTSAEKFVTEQLSMPFQGKHCWTRIDLRVTSAACWQRD